MAVIHKGSKSLNGQARQYLMTVAACVLMLAAYGAVLVKGLMSVEELAWYYLILPVLWIFGIGYYWRKYKQFKAGAKGESELLQYLKKLPRSYHVFTNYRIVEKRIRDEIDFVVVGNNGVFVIEVKNHVGRINGKADDIEWVQHKLGRNGSPYTKKMRNPVKQAKWHNINIERLINKAGIKLSTQVLLVFTNPKVALEIETDGMPVITDCDGVVNYILDKMTIHKLNGDKIKEVVDTLLEYEKKG